MWNIEKTNAYLKTASDKKGLEGYRSQLHALLQVKISAIECNIVLQNSWIANVDGGAASKDELNHFTEKMKAYQAACSGEHVDESADLLGQQIGEVQSSIDQA